ncbi:thioredoxin domain-containing protein 11-like [Oppia nitens]|uniref:thioredoxin domain-containing protein 11-like n=1 Tax=Oppia nitens TaxID=1686743 RepID=UPI0023DA479A|nr:thioredoxin domain-containing protein 11-like [Oppia nitens]
MYYSIEIECNNNNNNNNNNNMANELNENDISISVRLRPYKSFNNHCISSDVSTDDNNTHINNNINNNNNNTNDNNIIDNNIIDNKKKSWFTMRDGIKQTLICLVLAIGVTILAALHNGTLRIRKTPNPVKFFDEDMYPIVDYELGDLKQLSLRALQNDVSFVMYYAPWDSDCIRVMKEFETIAKHYRHQIFFAAINCWYPDGQCRQYYNLKRYPVLLAHVRMAGEVEYKGPLVASYMIPFLDNLLDPIIPVQNEGDLLDLRAKHDAILIGYFDFNESPQPPGYKQFFSTSVKALSSDPWRTVCYCVISSKRVATKLSLAKPQTLTLFLWNTTEHFGTKSIKSATILSWVYSRVQQTPTLKWLIPSGIKSSALSDIITKNPTFVLFTPRSFVLGISPYYDVLREVVMDYYNCDNSPLIRSIIHRSILRRHLLEEKLMELEEKCHELVQPISTIESTSTKKQVTNADTCCHSQVVRWRPSSKASDKKCFCTSCIHLSLAKCPSSCQRFNCLATASRYLTDFDPNSANKTATFCNQIKYSYQPKYTSYYKIVTTCSGIHPSLNEIDDNFFIMNSEDNSQTFDDTITKMVENSDLQHCHRLNLGLKYSDVNFPDSADSGNQQWRSNFTGLSCRTNRTLRFAALDSILFPAFAENIGIDIFNQSHATIGVIIDNSNENIHILTNDLSETQTINKRSFVEFIKNFTNKSLPRFLKSSSLPPTSGSCLSDSKERVICVPELSAETFGRVVLDPTKDVVVMYYAQWCGFCSTIAHIYLEVARIFSNIKGIVFTRLNGDANDLPWEYTVDRYPTIMLFPAKRKMESISFASNMAITTSSLVQFIWKHSQSSVRLQTSLTLCNYKCLLNNLASSQSHSHQTRRSLRNRLIELSLVRQKIIELFGSDKKLTKRKSTQLKQHLNYLIKTIRKLKQNIFKTSLLRSFIIEKLKNFDQNTDRLTTQSINEFLELFNITLPVDKVVKTRENKIKSETNKKSVKKTTKYSKQKSYTKRDEL